MSRSIEPSRGAPRIFTRVITAFVIFAATVMNGLAVASAQEMTSSQEATSSSLRQTSSHQIPVGSEPCSVSVDEGIQQTYVANRDGTLSVINDQNAVAKIIAVKKELIAVAANPATHMVYVTDVGGDVTVIDGVKDTIVATIPVAADPYGIDVNEATNKVYVADLKGVSVIDGRTNTVETTIAKEIGLDPYGVAVDEKNERVYVTDVDPAEQYASVKVIDTRINKVINEIVLGDSYPVIGGIVLDETNHKIYATNSSKMVYVIDSNTEMVIKTVRVSDFSRNITIDKENHKIFTTSPENDTVSVIDGNTDTVTKIFADTSPTGIAVAEKDQKLYVTNVTSDTVTVRDIETP